MKKYITFSIDDGSKYNLRLLELLQKYGLKATFYIPKHDTRFREKSLSDKEIETISRVQEIGAHSLNHVPLTSIALNQQRKEINGSKEYLENIISKEVSMFCYPFGIYNDEISSLVKQAGYVGARTTDCCFFEIKNPFAMGVSLQVYPFPLLKKTKEYSYFYWAKKLFQPLAQRGRVIKEYDLKYNSFFSWFGLAKNLFDYMQKNGGVFHIWGHSWEIEKFNMWKDLERFFKFLPKGKDIDYLSNGEIIKQLNL